MSKWRAALRPIYLSFYSAPFYREVGRELTGSWFGYLFFLVSLCAIPGMVGGYQVISDYFGSELPGIIRQIPPVRISGGRAYIDPPGPHVVVNPLDNTPFLILDTSGQTTSLDNTKASLLLMSDRMILRKDARETQVFMMRGLDNNVIDEVVLDGWRTAVWNWMTVIYFPVVALLSFAYRALQVLLFAVIALLYARRIHAPVDYTTALRLTVFAATPAIVTSAFRDLFHATSQLSTVFDFLILLVYLHFAVRANATPRSGSGIAISA
ncbi:MAG TPA: DUF1189 family protein [Candidatus Deferrimicrobiaceae bacterium]|jgi:hypothetical protein